MTMRRYRRDSLKQFLKKVEQQPGADGCWLWTGYKKRLGSPAAATARRWAWELWWAGRPIPVKSKVGNLCGRHFCVRPDHLQLVEGKSPEQENT